jgi:WD40 repeat protein
MSVAFSPDGKRIVSTAGDGTVKEWDATSGRELLAFKGHTGLVYSAAFSPNGNQIASGASPVKLWNARTGEEIHTLEGTFPPLAFSPDGKRLVTRIGDKPGGTLKVWDVSPWTR